MQMHQRIANENKQAKQKSIIKHATNNTKKIKVEKSTTKNENLSTKYNAKKWLINILKTLMKK